MNPLPETKPKEKPRNNFETGIVVLAWIFVGLGFVAAAFGLWVTEKAGGFTLANLSSCGSYLQGAVASIWSLAGLLFIFVAFLSQKRQLAIQEAELDGQKQQFVSQQQSIQLQSFEATFFQLIQALNQIVGEMKATKAGQIPEAGQMGEMPFEGRHCFAHWHEVFRNDFTPAKLAEIAGTEAPGDEAQEATARLHFEQFYTRRAAVLGHYFGFLYHTIKFIESSQALETYQDKRRYVSLVRAQLSPHELVFIFYNGISTMGVKFRPLIEKYGLLEHLDETLLLRAAHKGFYEQAYL